MPDRSATPHGQPPSPTTGRGSAPQRGSLRARLLLLAGSLVLTLLAVEVGFRLYSHFTGASFVEVFRDSEETWKRSWIERHRDRDIETFFGSDAYHPKFGWKPRPNLRKASFDGVAPVSTNARGWRNLRDFAFAKPAGVKRMVVVGDSFTFGEQEEDEHIWPAVLQDTLPKWDVINLGVHGYGTDQQLLVLQEEGVRYRPDVVVVGFFVHNIYRNTLRFRDYAKPRFVLDAGQLVLTNVPVPTPREVLADGDSGRPLSYAWFWLSQRLHHPRGMSPREALHHEMGQLTRAILAEMRATCQRCGAKMLVAIIPNPPKPEPQIEQAVIEWG